MPLIINGQTIDESTIEQEFSNIKAQFESMSGSFSCCERDDEFRGYARENVAARFLLMQEAVKGEIQIDEARIDAGIDELSEQHGGMDMLRIAYDVEEGEDDSVIRKDVTDRLKVEAYVQQLTDALAEPSDEDLSDYHKANIETYTTPKKVRASHILKAITQVEEKEETFELMMRLRDELLSGASIEALAKEHSDRVKEIEEAEEVDPDAGDGIDLGFFGKDEMMEEFATIAFSMAVGEVSPVFLTHYGYHLLTVTEIQSPEPIPFADIQDEVKAHFLEDRRESLIQHRVAELKEDAEIEYVEEVYEEDEALLTPDSEDD